jgi:hypothetical protein
MERLTVGSVLGSGAQLLARQLPRFLLLTVLCYAPVILWVSATLAGPAATDTEALDRMESVQQWARILSFLVDVPLASMLIYAVVRELHGDRPSLYETLVVGLRRSVPALFIMMLILLVMFALSVVMMTPVANTPSAAYVMVPALALVLLALYTRWFVAIPASVVERPGILGAFTRSTTLTAERRVPIALVIVITYVLEIGVFVACWQLILPAFDDPSPTAISETRHALPVFVLVQLVSSVLFAAIRAVFAATAYVQLRRDKDGTSPSELANVFS